MSAAPPPAAPSGPLSGLTVLDLSRLLPGPFASQILVQLGAEVLKVEAPAAGDYLRHMPPLVAGQSAAYAALNHSKRSLALDLKHPEGPALLRALAERADILIEGFRPGVMDRLGVGYEALRAVNPRLIYCAISGYGQTGPLSQRAGHDLGYLALTGLLSMGGLSAPGQPAQPVMPGVQVADLAGGSLYAVIGILAALLQRARTGLGQFVDAAITDGAASLGVMLQANDAAGQPQPAPGQDTLTGGRPAYGLYRCADGEWLTVSALEPHFFARFCALIGLPQLAHDGLAQGARAEKVRAQIEAQLATRPRGAWLALFEGEDLCVEPMLDLAQARTSPLARSRGWFDTAGDDTSPTPRLNPRLLPAHPPPAPTPAPALGADTEAALLKFGFEAAQIDQWREAGLFGRRRRS